MDTESLITGEHALIAAAGTGVKDSVEVLLNRGADVNAHDEIVETLFIMLVKEVTLMLWRCCLIMEPMPTEGVGDMAFVFFQQPSGATWISCVFSLRETLRAST